MKRLFRKYCYVVLIAVIVLTLAVVVQYTKNTNDVASWVFNFLKDWAVILSAIGAFLLAGIALFTILRERRSKAAQKINTWASDSLKLIINSIDMDILAVESKAVDVEESIASIISYLQTIDTEAIALIVDASNFSGTVEKMIDNIGSKCEEGMGLEYDKENADEFLTKLQSIRDSIFDDLVRIMMETS